MYKWYGSSEQSCEARSLAHHVQKWDRKLSKCLHWSGLTTWHFSTHTHKQCTLQIVMEEPKDKGKNASHKTIFILPADSFKKNAQIRFNLVNNKIYSTRQAITIWSLGQDVLKKSEWKRDVTNIKTCINWNNEFSRWCELCHSIFTEKWRPSQ